MHFSINKFSAFRLLPSLALLLLIVAPIVSKAQQYSVRQSKVAFTIEAPAGNLIANNEKLTGYIDISKGDLFFDLKVDQFRFVSTQMPDYLNELSTKRFCEYYLETEQYPKASFRGKITNIASLDLSRDGVHQIQVEGLLTMHGTSRRIVKTAVIQAQQGKLKLQTALVLKLEDFDIPVPDMLKNFFFQQVTVEVDGVLLPQIQ